MKKSNLYEIESYGADYSVEHVAMMYDRGDLIIPDFQRNYVWTLNQASRFIESCIIGLPIPSMFLFKKKEDSTYLVVDGQQRIQTIVYFKKGFFKDERTKFKLTNVAEEYEGCTYNDLSAEMRRRFDYAILRMTIFQQTEPKEGMNSVYEVFSRLNTGGRKLTSHEVRNAIYRGSINGFLKKLNEDSNWRVLYGKKTPDIHMKDEELILRYLALKDGLSVYEPPMNEFLNRYMEEHLESDDIWFKSEKETFAKTASLIKSVFGKDAFKLRNTLNSALSDAVMVVFSKNLTRLEEINKVELNSRFRELKNNRDFLDAIESGTSQTKKVNTRIELLSTKLLGR